jgi:hypothetical protein
MKSNFPYQPFIILGTARTGSTMLWSYLNSHPDILCLRGVFGSTNKINFGKFYGDLPEEYQSPELIKLRNERPIEFLEKYILKQYSKPFKAVGFKYFYDHDRHLMHKNELINYFRENMSIKFVNLRRDNLLAALFSYKRALAQQQWTRANNDFSINLSVEECDIYFKSICKNQNRFEELFPNRILQVKYDNLINATEQTLLTILEFIGVEKIKLTTETSKNREIRLENSIINYNELKSHFKNSSYAKYFLE